jgi:hypothetical protein
VRSLAPAPRHNDPPKTSQLDVSLPMKTPPCSGVTIFATSKDTDSCTHTMGCVSRDEGAARVQACELLLGQGANGVSLTMKALLDTRLLRAGPTSHEASSPSHQASSPSHQASSPSHEASSPARACSRPTSLSWGVSLPMKRSREDARRDPGERSRGGVSLPMKSACLSAQNLTKWFLMRKGECS